MRRLPRSARSILLTSNEVLLATDVAIISCCTFLGMKVGLQPLIKQPQRLKPLLPATASAGLKPCSTLAQYSNFLGPTFGTGRVSNYLLAPTLLVVGVCPSAKSRSRDALSVASQVKSGSLRPKCP